MPGKNGTGPVNIRQSFGRNTPGPGGNCICSNCGESVPHKRGVPCSTVNCPKCGAKMTRE